MKKVDLSFHFQALVESVDLNNETHFDGKKKMSTLKKKHCKNNGCNLSPLTAEQDLSYEEILVRGRPKTMSSQKR